MVKSGFFVILVKFADSILNLFDFSIFETSGNDLCLQVWNDYQLQWDEADYGGISVLR